MELGSGEDGDGEASICRGGVAASTDEDGRRGRGFYGASVLFGVCIL